MSNDVIFYTQVGSILGFVILLFTLYRMLVEQKDSVIQLLRERIIEKDEQITSLKSQSPDALAIALSDRIKMSLDEIARLKTDGNTHLQDISRKELELRGVQDRLDTLSELMQESDLVCPECGAPLVRRESHTIHGNIGEHEVETDVEYLEYQCGLSLDDCRELSPCKHRTV